MRQVVFWVIIAVRWVIGWWLNVYLLLKGSGWCAYCKCAWGWAESNDSVSAAPVCDVCFDFLSSSKIIRLVRKEIERYPPNDRSVDTEKEIEKIAKRIRQMKDEK